MNYNLTWKERIILQSLKKKWIVVLLISVFVGGICAFGYGKLKSSNYQASGELVQNDNNYNLLNSYQQFLTTGKFKASMNDSIKNSKWKKSSFSSEYTISMSYGTNSTFFSVNATSPNAEYSEFLANTAMTNLMSNIGSYLTGTNISVVSPAKTATTVTSKSRSMIIGGLGALVTFIILIAITLYRSVMAGKVKSTKYLTEVLGLNELGNLTLKSR
ncbi:hypothetical protein [Lactiplantibacillus plantarum]|uniref:hypothetical protein n=1 Tax=Lactiplantibacillus plantarum TaxID=1590 RepID=UPI0006AD7F69|nr:hypothetical protein [Lactiplantibacillus plantarum]ALC08221.1 polysaccharide biosynthesis protein [Lactiplantibacillus plantarum]MCG0631661.1 polysaccharide biosynthesis protein [Lactiplantibacillus plantarum]MCS8591319.1 hypothetical protein [Lactiplantibacillus plantarum]MDN7090340.1 hypothetical protein [Lactiplantibacillus plantarum]QHM49162.1 hypothetical protein C7M40_01107 [Lactiplantibacillus plantarum]